MDKLVHTVQVNVFETNQNSLQSIKDLYHKMLPIDHSKEQVEIDYEQLQGFNQKIIHSLTLTTIKNRHNSLILNTIFTSLPTKSINKIIDQIETRVNHEGNLFLRLDKPSLLNNSYRLIDHGNCFHIKIKLAAFPANKDNYLKSSYKLLTLYLESNDDEKKEKD